MPIGRLMKTVSHIQRQHHFDFRWDEFEAATAMTNGLEAKLYFGRVRAKWLLISPIAQVRRIAQGRSTAYGVLSSDLSVAG